MKKLLGLFMLAILTLVGCSQAEEKQDVIKVGMTTDSGSIDDKSFNQGSWEGVQQFASKHDNVETQYIQPKDETLQDYLNAVDNLILAGNQVIVLPGFKFEETANIVAQEYPEIKFILIDGQPLDGEEYVSHDNVVSIYFTEHEAGFLAGIASALQTNTGKLAFVGGYPIHSVDKFGWGYTAGVAYANKHLGTDAKVVDYIYAGSFTDVDAGKSIGGGLYDKGVDIIQHASGGVGIGIIAEAKTRYDNGEEVYVVGVDVDQYTEGITSSGKSIMLTSAMKRLDVAVSTHLEYWLNDEFKGGQVITMDFQQEGVGLPTENPNLTESTLIELEKVKEDLAKGEIVVPSTQEELIDFLDEYGYDHSDLF